MLKRLLFLLAITLLASGFLYSQVTTGTITGTVKSSTGEALAGATITAIHVPTGTKYVTAAKSGGQYTVPNVRVGGPYNVTAHFTGFADQVFNDLNVSLGTPLSIDVVLSVSS